MTPSSSSNSWSKPLLVLVALLVVVGLWAHVAGGIFLATHQRSFGEATPLTLYQYWLYYGDDKSVEKWLLISGGLSFLLVFSPGLIFLLPSKRSLFGDARFAKRSDVKKAGLFGDKGIIVGLFDGRYLMFGGAQHVIMSAPTRGGKGVGVVIPNLLTWPDSVVVLDVKQENHAITSGYRQKHGQAVLSLQPCGDRLPLAPVQRPRIHQRGSEPSGSTIHRRSPECSSRTCRERTRSGRPRHARCSIGIVLFLLETPGKLVSIGQVLRESLADGDGSKYFTSLINTRALAQRIKETAAEQAAKTAEQDVANVLSDRSKAPGHHPKLAEMAVWAYVSPAYKTALEEASAGFVTREPEVPKVSDLVACTPFDKVSADLARALSGSCVRALNSYTSIASENTRAGVMTSFRSRLELWNNPLVDAATSANDFDLRDLRKKRMSVYLGVTPDNLDRMAPLLNLFFQLLIDLNTRELPERNKALKYQCLLLCDEFTAMGKVGVLSKGISYIAGYGLRMLPIIQSPMQVVETYGKEAAQTFTHEPCAADRLPAESHRSGNGQKHLRVARVSNRRRRVGVEGQGPLWQEDADAKHERSAARAASATGNNLPRSRSPARGRRRLPAHPGQQDSLLRRSGIHGPVEERLGRAAALRQKAARSGRAQRGCDAWEPFGTRSQDRRRLARGYGRYSHLRARRSGKHGRRRVQAADVAERHAALELVSGFAVRLGLGEVDADGAAESNLS